MRRFAITLAAAAASACVATGVTALNAVGDERPTPADLATFADCLRAEGVDVPSDVGTRLEQWLRAHQAEAGDAVLACKAEGPDKPAVPEELLECLRARGLNPPTAPDALKLWIARTPEARACAEPPKEGAPSCGEAEEPPRATERS